MIKERCLQVWRYFGIPSDESHARSRQHAAVGSRKVDEMMRLRWLVPLLSVVILATAVSSWGGVFVSVAIGPPALPVYSQPFCPGPGYIWTPGYWAWSPDGYYWVPGTWVLPPQVGFLWTPGYWGFSAGLYNWHPGYWGPRVGFYGGINYGFGYTGYGYAGGYWHGRDFYYNRSVNNVNVTNVHNVYNQTVVNNVNVNRASYNGGPHGIQARPTSDQLTAERAQHFAATPVQAQHEQAARNDRAQLASVNHGRPAVAATPRPGALNSRESAQMNHPQAAPGATSAAHEVPRPPQNHQQNTQQVRAQNNPVPRPPQNNRVQQQASVNVPRPPNSHQPASATGNVPRPGDNGHQPVPQPQQHMNNHPAQQAQNVSHPNTAARATTQPHPQPQQQARQAYNPPRQAAPQQVHTAAHPRSTMTQQPPSTRQSQLPHQTVARQAPPPAGHQQQRPH